MNPKLDFFFEKATKWQEELMKLREIVLDCGLAEELKWGVPCYTFHKTNVVLIHGFKEYCAINFFKGVLLSDAEGILIQQTENVQEARQIRFTSLQQIIEMLSTVKAYIFEAIEVEKIGLKVTLKKTEDFELIAEFQRVLDKYTEINTAFYALTPGRQRAYLLHFSAPKQSSTRESRIEKCISQILKGKGLNDCTCGLSKRLPNCDGSHKYINT
jgi:uncharacterized protein YdeI (YjbR/CyaY-like superfamily)